MISQTKLSTVPVILPRPADSSITPKAALPRLRAPAPPPIAAADFWTSPTNDQKVDRTIAYVKHHFTENLGPGNLASIAHISRSHFFVLFKQRTGMTPLQYVLRLRMREGARLLRHTAIKIKSVAAAVGYDDPFYFSRVFKMTFHVSPSNYRSRRAQNARGARRIRRILFGEPRKISSPVHDVSATNHSEKAGGIPPV